MIKDVSSLNLSPNIGRKKQCLLFPTSSFHNHITNRPETSCPLIPILHKGTDCLLFQSSIVDHWFGNKGMNLSPLFLTWALEALGTLEPE